eukprot:TRINITY_DN3785_c0_g1_i1.p1 TRINITY_DN3785_c0_g1~~TRINITY_DN3785_c0_g1_i1.p1  ORF type:complete len:169 (-),score=31.52 TRINITY_DN3785_c0_g1_i1:194-700(-)
MEEMKTSIYHRIEGYLLNNNFEEIVKAANEIELRSLDWEVFHKMLWYYFTSYLVIHIDQPYIVKIKPILMDAILSNNIRMAERDKGRLLFHWPQEDRSSKEDFLDVECEKKKQQENNNHDTRSFALCTSGNRLLSINTNHRSSFILEEDEGKLRWWHYIRRHVFLPCS